MSQLQHARSFRELIVLLKPMIEKAASFCGELPLTLRESTVAHFTTNDDRSLMTDH